MNSIAKIAVGIAMVWAFASCEKPLDLSIAEAKSSLVVEAWIEQGKGPSVLLSLTAPYFTSIDSNNLRDYGVTQAKVTVVGPESTEVLTLKPNAVYFPPYYYFGITLKGKLGASYELIVDYRGETYTANTSIPALVIPDSVWFERNSETDTLGLIKLRISDDNAEMNYYRTFTRRIGKDNRFIPTFTSVFSDETFNGNTLELSLSRGNATLLEIGSNRFFAVGDTIILKFCSLDKTHFDFWKAYQNSVISSGNPFSVNNSGLHGNIDEGFGVWGGYAASYDTLVAR